LILVDDRSGSSELAPLLQSAELTRLDYGDFAWVGNGPHGPAIVGVERKTLLDLLSSIQSGRLSGHQLVGMTNAYDWSYLLVEGVWRPDMRTGILQRISRGGKWIEAAKGARRFMARDLFNFFQTVTIMCGVVVVKTGNMDETAKWLQSAAGWWGKPWEGHRSHLQFTKPSRHAQLRKPSPVVRMASQLDGVGWDKARRLGEEFPTIMDLVLAGGRDLMRVDGIGPKLAARIRRQIDGL